MDISKIPPGRNPPDEINAVIEIPGNENGGSPVKYEIDPSSGILRVDRILLTPMFFPCNYGFIPNTSNLDSDALDILVRTNVNLVPGCVIRCKPIAVLKMQGEKGPDPKILAIPVPNVDPLQKHILDLEDIPDLEKDRIKHFFEHYKDLEKDKWMKIQEWADAATAKEIIMQSIKEKGFHDPDTAPDLSQGVWPEKFAKAEVQQGQGNPDFQDPDAAPDLSKGVWPEKLAQTLVQLGDPQG